METFSALLAFNLSVEFPGHRWIPRTKASDAKLWCFFDLRLNKWSKRRDAGNLRRHRANYDAIVVVWYWSLNTHTVSVDSFAVCIKPLRIVIINNARLNNTTMSWMLFLVKIWCWTCWPQWGVNCVQTQLYISVLSLMSYMQYRVKLDLVITILGCLFYRITATKVDFESDLEIRWKEVFFFPRCLALTCVLCRLSPVSDLGQTERVIQWNLSVTTTSIIKSITCDLFSSMF